MRPTPADEWQRLTKLYSEMPDGALLELAETYGDLTEIAQPILRDEMKKRGLGEDVLQPPPDPSGRKTAFARIVPRFSESDRDAETPEDGGHAEPLHEYTWKTELCSCNSSEEAWQICEVLRLAGIESWTDSPAAEQALDLRNIRILVAADQLDEARAVTARPIPQDIIDQSKMPDEEFVAPTCPKCRSEEVLLVANEPTNQWRCDECGAEWSDSAPANSAPSESVS
jgi:hypothetical protein